MTSTSFLLALGGALWLGILTSISPCPLATNVAAVAYLVQGDMGRTRRDMFISGAAYVAGRTLVTILLGVVVVTGILSLPGLSALLQRSMNKLAGPLLLIVGVFLLDLVPLSFPWSGKTESLRFSRNAGGAFLLGVLFGLALCPVAAALFFGTLVPLAVEHSSPFLLPLFYGVGTGLPVIAAAALLGKGMHSAATLLLTFSSVEKLSRLVTGGIFLLLGTYLIFRHVFLLL
ncbi:aromatic aminobenezylarsenical efflux permease ArsG family transporter [Aminiphilus circumscriptus]|jgi:cytochrome c-type biogenesis protein|uniref:aromatic aminobenezylarsenical efflux permease ArsG family transporter n=1 Tax=Aminiphilus circumscriptus TaxID=290732 RepID=UPI00049254E6|nr:aromatic aminobenezylarsenical efflux permease ArsG family transporter [Aminiphilus circumscriptus]